jgi:prepilin-type N-terminal cleavage/methylation domain-containing protein
MTARRGMTLMELVIGIAITGMMAAVGAGTFGTIIDRRRAIRDATAETERSAALREMIRGWLVAGTPIYQVGGAANQGVQAGSPAATAGTATAAGTTAAGTGLTAAVSSSDEITISTQAATPANVPTTQRLRIFIDADPATPETGLTIEYQATPTTPLQRRQLEPAVGALKVEILDSVSGRWYAMSEASALTGRIALRFTMLPPDKGTLPPLLLLPIMIRLGQQQ